MNLDNLFSLAGKTAVITGAAQGLGRDISLALSHLGASLILADINIPNESRLLIEKNNGTCIAIQTDVTDESQVLGLAQAALSEFGKIDILVNNAGISQLGFTKTQELSADEWDRIIDTNLKGTFLCCKNIGRSMIEIGHGSIINIASTAGIVGIPRAPAYCASKAGIISLTQSLALEWAQHGVRMNAIAPHYLETDLTKGLRDSKKVHDAILKQIPMKRLGKTIDVIGAIVYLGSDASQFTTGTVIPVDGGFLSQ